MYPSLYLSLRTNVKPDSLRGRFISSCNLFFTRIQRCVDVSVISIGLWHVSNSVHSVNSRMRQLLGTEYPFSSFFAVFNILRVSRSWKICAFLSVKLLSSTARSEQSESFEPNRISNLAEVFLPVTRELVRSADRWFLLRVKERKEKKIFHWKYRNLQFEGS